MSTRRSRLRKGEVLILKCVGPDGEAHGDFRWPLEVGAVVEAPDWDPAPRCGGGLHGWLWGVGDISACGSRHLQADTVWMAVAVAEFVDLGGKVKFPRGRIVATGDRTAVASLISSHAPRGTPCSMFSQAAAGSRGQAAAGYAGQAAAGYAGQAAAGEAGQAAAGSRGQAAAGPGGLATCAPGGIVKGGTRACLVAGYWTGPNGDEPAYVMGQVGRGDIQPETWYEGAPDGLRPVAADDERVQTWDRAWALFEERREARERLQAEAHQRAQAAQTAAATALDNIRASIKPVEVS